MTRQQANTYFNAIFGTASGAGLFYVTLHPKSAIAGMVTNYIISTLLLGNGIFNLHQAYANRRVSSKPSKPYEI